MTDLQQKLRNHRNTTIVKEHPKAMTKRLTLQEKELKSALQEVKEGKTRPIEELIRELDLQKSITNCTQNGSSNK
jgi:hypothetical protein